MHKHSLGRRSDDFTPEEVKNMYREEYLAHHGVLGMKWGVRRYQPYSDGRSGGKFVGKKKEKKNRKGSEDYLEYKRLKKKGVKNLSNEELERYITRKELLDKYYAKPEGKKITENFIKQEAVKKAAAVASVAAVSAGAYFLMKKYNVTLDSATRAFVRTSFKTGRIVIDETGREIGRAAKAVGKRVVRGV